MTPVAPATWTEDDRALWARIAAHDFEPAADQLTFTGRLARDHGWSLETARRAVEEYRRFCFLALRDGAGVTPSEEVDEVWHQHLTFSRDYWLVWCRTVLRAPLHHDPTRGGPSEGRRFVARYTATLALYEQWFGPPPADFWPGTAERFGKGPRFRIVDRATHLVLPAPRAALGPARRCARTFSLGALPALPLFGSALVPLFNVLDWAPGPLLVLYSLAATLWLLRLVSRLPFLFAPAAASTAIRERWHAAELALLAGGRQRAADVITLQAMAAGYAKVKGSRILIGGGRDTSRSRILRDLSGTIDKLQVRLANEGLAMSTQRDALVRIATFSAFLPVMGLGVAELTTGLGRHRSVGLPGGLLLLTVAVALVLTFRRRPASRAGRIALNAFKARHARMLRAPQSNDVYVAFAFNGARALFGTAFEPFGKLMSPDDNNVSVDFGVKSNR